MELVEVTLALPDVFKEVEDVMKKVDLGPRGDFMIAGGSLSNLYMGKPIKDIDIFVCNTNYDQPFNEELLRQLFGQEAEIETEMVPGYRDWFEIPCLYRISYKGFTLEFIPASIERVYDFDLRFRQFFMRNGKVFASKGALEDIEKKKITIVSPATPLSTLVRVLRFQEQFGFDLDPVSEEYLLWYMSKVGMSKDYVYDYIEKANYTTETVKKSYREFIRKHKFQVNGSGYLYVENASFPFDHEIESKVYEYLVNKDYQGLGIFYEELCVYKKINLPSFTLPICDVRYFKSVEPFIELLNKLLEKNKLRAIASGISTKFSSFPFPEKLARFRDYLGNATMKELLPYVEMETLEERFIYHLEKLKPLPKEVTVTFVANDDQNVSIGDAFTRRSIKMVINDTIHYRLRKCTNGKYTLGGLHNLNGNTNAVFHLKVIFESLSHYRPDLFEFSNSNILGEFSYNKELNGSIDHFFGPFYAPQTFIDQPKKKFTKRIDLSKRSE